VNEDRLLAEIRLFRVDGSIAAVVKVKPDGSKTIVGNRGAVALLQGEIAKALLAKDTP